MQIENFVEQDWEIFNVYDNKILLKKRTVLSEYKFFDLETKKYSGTLEQVCDNGAEFLYKLEGKNFSASKQGIKETEHLLESYNYYKYENFTYIGSYKLLCKNLKTMEIHRFNKCKRTGRGFFINGTKFLDGETGKIYKNCSKKIYNFWIQEYILDTKSHHIILAYKLYTKFSLKIVHLLLPEEREKIRIFLLSIRKKQIKKLPKFLVEIIFAKI